MHALLKIALCFVLADWNKKGSFYFYGSFILWLREISIFCGNISLWLVQLGSSHQALTVTQKSSEVKPQNYEFHTTGCPKSDPVPARMMRGARLRPWHVNRISRWNKSLRVWNQERINPFLTRHRVAINNDDDNSFIYLGSPILGRVTATGLPIRSSLDRTSCGIFVCGPLHCLNVNLLLILGAVGLLNFRDPICCSILHVFAHVSKDGFVHPTFSLRTWHLESCSLGDTWYGVILSVKLSSMLGL